MKLSDTPTREEVLYFISTSSTYGNLGLFVGAGFSKAIMNDVHAVALSWRELIRESATMLGIDYQSIQQEGLSYPEIATRVCQQHSVTDGIPYKESTSKLKQTIAKLTCWYPDKAKRESFGRYLSSIDPSWIITTNYDLIIESLLTGRSISLGPEEQLIIPREAIPVYHLHGTRTNPESIVITNEDYISLFRPNEYRQLKLSLLLKESTTLIIGYGLGDVNVLTAVDWARNVFNKQADFFPHDMIQLVRSLQPSQNPYRDKNNIIIIETENISSFLEDLSAAVSMKKKSNEERKTGLKEISDLFLAPSDAMMDKFITDAAYRARTLGLLSRYENYVISGFLEFLSLCIEKTWARSAESGAFFAYDQNVRMLLDIIILINIHKMPPALFHFIMDQFERVAPSIGFSSGQSWDAKRTWDRKKGDIARETTEEIFTYATSQVLNHTMRLFQEIRA